MAPDRGETAGHRVAEHPPAVADRPQSVGRTKAIPGAELVEQVQRVGKQLVGGDGVAGKPVAVDQQNPPTGPREQGGHGGTGAPGAHDDRVVLLVLSMTDLTAVPRFLAAWEPAWPGERGRSVEAPWTCDHGAASLPPPPVGGTEARVDLLGLLQPIGRPVAVSAAAEQPPPGLQRGGPLPRQPEGGEHLDGAGQAGVGPGCRRGAPRRPPPGPARPARRVPRQSSPPDRISSHRDRCSSASAGRSAAQQLGQLGPGGQLGRHLPVVARRRPRPSPARRPRRPDRRARAGPRRATGVFRAASCRSPAASSAAAAAAQSRSACSQFPSRKVSIRRATASWGSESAASCAALELAQGGERQAELVDHRAMGMVEGGEPGLSQAPPAPRPRRAGVQEVGVGHQRRRVHRHPSQVGIGQLVSGVPTPLPDRRGVGQPSLVHRGPAPGPAGDDRQIPPAQRLAAMASL